MRERANIITIMSYERTHSPSVDSSAARIHFSPFSFHLPFQLYCNLFKPRLSYILRVFSVALFLSLCFCQRPCYSELIAYFCVCRHRWARCHCRRHRFMCVPWIHNTHTHTHTDTQREWTRYNFKLFICLFLLLFFPFFHSLLSLCVCVSICNCRHVPTWSLLLHAL